jgi:hypothetical protein
MRWRTLDTVDSCDSVYRSYEFPCEHPAYACQKTPCHILNSCKVSLLCEPPYAYSERLVRKTKWCIPYIYKTFPLCEVSSDVWRYSFSWIPCHTLNSRKISPPLFPLSNWSTWEQGCGSRLI